MHIKGLGYRLVGAAMVIGIHAPILADTAWPTPPVHWHATVGGLSHHARETLAPGRQWRESHSGLGLQRRTSGVPWNSAAGPEWRTRLHFGTLEDSRGFLGSYGGVAVMRELAHWGTFRLEGGAGSTLHYRSKSWRGHMRLVPVFMPSLSLTEVRSGFGVDLSWVPPVQLGSSGGISTFLLQLNYRVEH
jgi:hypothetical protein